MNRLLKSGVIALVVALGAGGLSVAAKEKKAMGPKTLTIDASASTLKWIGKKVTGQHDGTVNLKSGQVLMDKGALTGGEFVVDMTTIKVDDLKDADSNAKLTGHLKSDDFFSVEKNPTALFKITQAAPGAVKGTHSVTGDLTIKGVTHPVTFPVTVTEKDGKTQAKGTVSVDRTKYDIKYGSGKFFKGLGDKVIHDDFTIELTLVAK